MNRIVPLVMAFFAIITLQAQTPISQPTDTVVRDFERV